METAWRPITPLDRQVQKSLREDLALLDGLLGSGRGPAPSHRGVDAPRRWRRALHRHAVETGAIELLYRVDQDTTEALVAEGFGRETTGPTGVGLAPSLATMLRFQLEGLEMVNGHVRDGYPLTTSIIKQAHALITRSQTTYGATDSLGRSLRARLTHGAFKTLPNNVRRGDGSLVRFAPPEQVNGEVERLVDWYNEMEDIHPVVSAAWLHHRFIRIHPFQDGNGRVGRALTLFPTTRGGYPPIVVERRDRSRYFAGLDAANQDDLAPLVRLFTEFLSRSVRIDFPHRSDR